MKAASRTSAQPPDRRRGAARGRRAGRRGRVRRPDDRRDRRAGRHQQAGDLPPLAEQGAPACTRRRSPRTASGSPCPTPGRWPTTCAEMLRRTSAAVRRPGRPRRAARPDGRVRRRPGAARRAARAVRRASGRRSTTGSRSPPSAARCAPTLDPDVLIETLAGAALMRLLIRGTPTGSTTTGSTHHRPADERDRPMTAYRVHRGLARAARHAPRPRPGVPRGRPRGAGDDRHVADGYRALATTLGRRLRHLPVRRAEPAGLRRPQHAVPPRPALGRRQHRRLLPPRAGRPAAAATGSPATAATRLLRAHRLQRAVPRHLVGQDRAARQRHRPRRSTPTATSPSRSGPRPAVRRVFVELADASSRSPATTRSTR